MNCNNTKILLLLLRFPLNLSFWCCCASQLKSTHLNWNISINFVSGWILYLLNITYTVLVQAWTAISCRILFNPFTFWFVLVTFWYFLKIELCFHYHFMLQSFLDLLSHPDNTDSSFILNIAVKVLLFSTFFVQKWVWFVSLHQLSFNRS